MSKPTSAHIVVGPESSGTRFLTSILIDAGCEGDATHRQRWDRGVPEARKHRHIVWRKSVPHGHNWPQLTNLASLLSKHGYVKIYVVVLVREPYALHRSQIKRGHVPDLAAAWKNTRRAYLYIFAHLAKLAKAGVPFLIVPYEALALQGVPARRAILKQLGLELLRPRVKPRNENAKHYK